VTWPAILALAAASYGLKALGTVLLGDREIRPPVRALLDLAPVPLLAALILTQTISTAGAYAIDARLPALGVAALLVWRRAPFLVVVVAAAATAALLRAV
jgi:branched-subunit amino acid transport protein